MESSLLVLSVLAFRTLTVSAEVLTPPDLIAYNEKVSTYLWRVEEATPGDRQVVMYTCPKDTPITDVSQCSSPVKICKVTDFRAMVHAIVLDYALTNSKKDLNPLKAADLELLLANPNLTLNPADYDALKADLQKSKDMIKILPNSPAYKKSIDDTERLLSAISPVINADDEVIDKFYELIEKNDANSKPNFFARSQMVGTLINETLSFLYQDLGDQKFFPRWYLHAHSTCGIFSMVFSPVQNGEEHVMVKQNGERWTEFDTDNASEMKYIINMLKQSGKCN